MPVVGIVDEDVGRVREATDFIALASEYVALKRVGRQWQGLCPFHAERSPSFSVNPELGRPRVRLALLVTKELALKPGKGSTFTVELPVPE